MVIVIFCIRPWFVYYFFMFKNIKTFFKFKWSSGRNTINKETKTILKCLIKLLENILLWENMWLSLGFLLYMNIIFAICFYKDVNLFQFSIAISIVLTSLDAFETWLKYKHRNSFLRSILPEEDSIKLYQAAVRVKIWIKKRWNQFIQLREMNHTKAFLLTNIFLGFIYVIGKSINGYTIMYMLCMSATLAQPVLPYIKRTIKKVQQHAESDSEIESLIPVVSEQEMKDLTFEVDGALEKQKSIDILGLDELQPGETSDSSDNNSITTNMTKETMSLLDNDVNDSSETSDDEYIPTVQQEKLPLRSTLEVIEPNTWSNSAYSVLQSVTGVIGGMMFTQTESQSRKAHRVPSMDSSDGFELIDEDDL